tara:strand:- start:7 stop:738 length:732 start_codon:yes stop_codon:yes gene_type:complete
MKDCNNPKCNNKGVKLFSKNKNNKDGLSHRCKECVKTSVKSSTLKKKEYYREDMRERSEVYRKENPLKVIENTKKFGKIYKENGYWGEYYQDNKERLSEYSKQEHVRVKRNNRWRERYKNDVDFRLKEIMKACFHQFFKDKGGKKNYKFSKVVNYTQLQLKTHLENNFREGMTWGNMGTHWEIHHIKPQNLFSLDSEKDIRECWDMSNLTPLWVTTSISHAMGDIIRGNRNIGKTEIYNPAKI